MEGKLKGALNPIVIVILVGLLLAFVATQNNVPKAVIGTTTSGFTTLSVSKPDYIGQGQNYLVTALGNSGADSYVSTMESSAFGSNNGSKANYSLKLTATQFGSGACVFNGVQTGFMQKIDFLSSINNYFLLIDAVNECKRQAGARTAYPISYGGLPVRLDCYVDNAGYAVGRFDQQNAQLDSQVTVDAVAVGSNQTVASFLFTPASQKTFTDNATGIVATWTGNVLSYDLCPSSSGVFEARDLTQFGTTVWTLLDAHALQTTYPIVRSSFSTCLIQYGDASGSYRSGAVNCISNYNSGVRGVFNSYPQPQSIFGGDKTTLDSANNKARTEGDYFSPQLTLKIPALYLGIQQSVGIPSNPVCSAGQQIAGGTTQTKTITVTNTGNSGGSFSASASCSNGISVVNSPAQQNLNNDQQGTFTFTMSYPATSAGSGSCALTVAAYGYATPASCSIQDSWSQITNQGCVAPFVLNLETNHCDCPLVGQQPEQGYKLDSNSCTFIASGAPTTAPTTAPTANASASSACIPFIQRSATSSETQGGFNIPLLGNIGGTQVVTTSCVFDFTGIIILGVLALVGYGLYSGSLSPEDLTSSRFLIPVGAGLITYFILASFNVPLLGQPLAGLAPLGGFLVGLFAWNKTG